MCTVAALVLVYRVGMARGWFGGRAGEPLNVLLITADTTRADYLGCYGRTAAQTPNIDRLARAGTQFCRCVTSSVQTLPSHCTIMTGLYPFVHGVRRNGTDQLPPAAVTLAEALKSAGFATRAALGSYVLDGRFGMAQGFDEYRTVPAPQAGTDPAAAQRKGDQVCADALDMLTKSARERFFLWVHFYDPHYPYESARVPDPESPAAYADEITFMDTQIGRLLDRLRELGLDQRTLVILVGDHGEGLDDHDEFEHSFFAYETTVQVPFIAACPGVVPPNHVVADVVRTLDIAPTMLDLLGLPPLPDAQGVSLRPLLDKAEHHLDLTAYAEAGEPHTLFRLARIRTLTAGPLKYIHAPTPQLYDLLADPGEQQDLASARPADVARLREQLRALLADAPPRLAEDSSLRLAHHELARLESLGYLGVAADPAEQDLSEVDLFEPRGVDPHLHIRAISTYQRARIAIAHGQHATAEAQLQSVLTALADAPAPLRDLADVLARQGKFDAAIQSYERVLALTPEDSRTRAQYASMLLGARRWDAAATQATQVLALTPNDAAAHSMLGVAYSGMERYGEACAHFEAAVRLEPRNPNALHALGQVYTRLGRLDQAADCFRRVLALDPRSERARAALQAVEQARPH